MGSEKWGVRRKKGIAQRITSERFFSRRAWESRGNLFLLARPGRSLGGVVFRLKSEKQGQSPSLRCTVMQIGVGRNR